MRPHAPYDINIFLSQNLHYPESARKMGIEGRVIVRFIVDENGNIRQPEMIRSPDSSLTNEAMRVMKLMPKWIPGKNGGKFVALAFTMPIIFKLD